MATVFVAAAKARDVAEVELDGLLSELEVMELFHPKFKRLILKLVVKSAIAGAEHLKKVEQIEADLKIMVSGG